MNNFMHFIAHLFGWNCGQVVSKLDTDGNVWIGFQCSGCGQISGRHIAARARGYPEHLQTVEELTDG